MASAQPGDYVPLFFIRQLLQDIFASARFVYIFAIIGYSPFGLSYIFVKATLLDGESMMR